jgi:hypothetical protein
VYPSPGKRRADPRDRTEWCRIEPGFEIFYGAHLPRIVRACSLVLLEVAMSETTLGGLDGTSILDILNSIRISET